VFLGARHMALSVLSKTKFRSLIALLCLILSRAQASFSSETQGPPATRQEASPTGQLHVTVMDPNGQALPAVFVLVEKGAEIISQVRTTPSGIALLSHLAPGTYKVVLQAEGFYQASVERVVIAAGETAPMEVRLQPVREYHTEIEVTAQPSPIDPEQTTSSESITANEIATIPYPTTRDYRNVLPYIPGVIADATGQIHIAGSSTQEIQDYVDGFVISQPAGGALTMRVNPDSLRKIDVVNSRYSAMFGQGSGGFTDFAIQDGDNRFRFNATDFIPTVQNVKGIQFNNWTPRAYISGPIIRDKVWFNVSHEGEIDNNVVKQLPSNADTNQVWRSSDLVRLRMNLTEGNVLTASALWNPLDSDNTGITALDPVSVSTNVQSNLYLVTLKDQITLAQSNLLEFGAAFHQTNTTSVPQGLSPYVLTLNGRTGNFFETTASVSERTQGFSNLYLKPWKRFGSHQVTIGGRVDRVFFHDLASRVPIQFTGAGNVLLRQINFQNVPAFDLSTLESSAYAQDRWSALERLVIEAGARWDRDSFLGQNMFSPRLAGSFMVHRPTETKLSAGIGVYYDRTNLALVSQANQGSLTDVFFAPVSTTVHTSFIVNPSLLTMPRYVNWSAGIERRLPGKVYIQVQFLSREGAHGWAYVSQPNGDFLLKSTRQDQYHGFQITARKELKRGYPFLISYTRSSARSNETVDFTLDNFIIGNQQPGPLPWDSPNQLQSWGSLPLFGKLRKFDIAYSTIWRSGFPFFTVNQFGELVSIPGQFRFPDFFTLNIAVERKFNFKGYRWAARIGVENVTNSSNPSTVDNNVDSPSFLTFFGQGHRTLNGRIRFLGKATK
jgi:Carboxypeptidase regulatory-like domain/TonB-dependent Receptor Plug Domain